MTDAYFARAALSQSGAKTLRVSPQQYAHEREHPKPPTPAMVFGSLVHALTLEPHTVRNVYSTGPDLSGVCTKDGKPAANPSATAEGKALIADWYAANPHLTVVSPGDWATAEAMANAALSCVHPRIGLTLADLLALRDARVEQEVYWQDGKTGCQLKAKLDAVVTLPSGEVLAIDLKTTTSALTNKELASTAVNFGYVSQASHYLEALAQGGVSEAAFWFLFCSKTPPHECAWQTLDGEALTQGAREMRSAKYIYAACQKSGVWPSAQACGLLGDTISLPRWYEGASDE